MGVPAGTRIGPYEITESLGSGGMGEVYRARDTSLKRDVAIKVLPESFVNDANRLARFQREAEVLASLNHTNIGQIYGLERSAGTTALVMELVEGPTLAERIAQGTLPVDEALNVAMQIAAALEAAHERQIVHRDLKPANVKLRPDGTVKVLDFGIAKAIETRIMSGPQAPALTTPAMTQAGVVLGTAAYMAPEQARGKVVDERADIWAFGCVLYEMLTGQPAFGGDDATVTLARVLEREVNMHELPRGLSPSVRRTIELCLQKDPKKRIRHVSDLRLALEGRFETALSGAQAAPARPFWRRALPVAGSVAVGLVAGAYVWDRTRPSTVAPPATPVTRFAITPPAEAPLASLVSSDVAISPDGHRLAYFATDSQTGGVALYIRELGSLEARRIPDTDLPQQPPQGEMNPFFSPDGKWIGFWSLQRGVVRVSVDGAPPITILDDREGQSFGGAAWGADDTVIYSWRGALYRISAAGKGTPEHLTPDMTAFAFPALLPGERAVLVNELEFGPDGVPNGVHIAVVDLQTGEHKIVVDGGTNAIYAPTGHVVFVQGTTLMAAPFDATELVVTGEPVALFPGVRHPNKFTAADYALSATGTLVYVQGGDDSAADDAVVWVDRAGRVVERAVDELITNPRDPRVSRDGGRFVLTTGDADLWVYDLGGKPPIPLAVDGDNWLGIWSPDGTEIAFAGNGQLEVYTTRSDGSGAPRPLRPGELMGAPWVWSSAGELLLTFPRQYANPDIFATAAAAVGDVRAVVVTDTAELDPALSPNGRWLAYTSMRTGEPEVWVKGYPEGVPERVSRNGGYEPRWSADGRELFFLQGSAMMAVAVETDGKFSLATPGQLFSGPYYTQPTGPRRTYDVAPDGRFLMIQQDAGQSSIVVVQNWFEELAQRVPTN